MAISLGDVWDSLQDPRRLQKYCAYLEAGDIIYFPETPIQIAPADLDFLLNQQQVGAGYRKNIAYKPSEDRVTGFVAQSPETGERLQKIMRKYSRDVVEFLEHSSLAPGVRTNPTPPQGCRDYGPL